MQGMERARHPEAKLGLVFAGGFFGRSARVSLHPRAMMTHPAWGYMKQAEHQRAAEAHLWVLHDEPRWLAGAALAGLRDVRDGARGDDAALAHADRGVAVVKRGAEAVQEGDRERAEVDARARWQISLQHLDLAGGATESGAHRRGAPGDGRGGEWEGRAAIASGDGDSGRASSSA